MTRIATETPGASVPKQAKALVSQTPTWTVIAEAVDFETPSDDDGEGLIVVPGRTRFGSALLFTNVSGSVVSYDLQFLLEDGTEIWLADSIEIQPNDVSVFPIQGQSLLKLSAASANGDRLRIRASAEGAVYACVDVKEGSAEQHAPEEEE
jgi:hypothetical protein